MKPSLAMKSPGECSPTLHYMAACFSQAMTRSGALGIGQNMLWLGALSFDVTWADSHFDTQQDEQGYSYRFNYSEQVDATNSTISLAAYRFSDRHFHSYANYIDHKYNDADAQDEKQTISLSFGQPITPLNLNLYANPASELVECGIPPPRPTLPSVLTSTLATGKIFLSRPRSTPPIMKIKIATTRLLISLPIGESGRLGMTCRTTVILPPTACRGTIPWMNETVMSAGIQSDRPDNGAQVSGNYQHLSSAGEWDLTGTYAANDYTLPPVPVGAARLCNAKIIGRFSPFLMSAIGH
ncbi:fimbria/pilus outer membrane usher protein [Escherichia coli]